MFSTVTRVSAFEFWIETLKLTSREKSKQEKSSHTRELKIQPAAVWTSLDQWNFPMVS